MNTRTPADRETGFVPGSVTRPGLVPEVLPTGTEEGH